MTSHGQPVRRIGLVSFAASDLHHQPRDLSAIIDILATAGCHVVATSLRPGRPDTILHSSSLPRPLELLIAGNASSAGELSINARTPSSRAGRVLTESAVPGKRLIPSDPSHVLADRDFPRRLLRAGVFVLIEREINLVVAQRPGGFTEALPLSAFLATHSVSLIVHASRRYMRRWEIDKKRNWLSQRGRSVIGIWGWLPRGHADPRVPWRIHHERRNLTGTVEEIARHDYARIGVVELPNPA